MKNSSPLQTNIYFYFIIAATAFSVSVNAESPHSTIDTLTSARNLISTRLDSLDVQKQEHKRMGLSVTELESLQTELHDSLLRINEKFIKHKATLDLKKSAPQSGPTLLRTPNSLFDWVIFIVGFIAFFSGILLVSGIIKSIRKKRKNKRVTRSPAAPATHEPVQSYQLYSSKGEVKKPLQEQQQLSDVEALHALKQRITNVDQSSGTLPPPNKIVAPLPPSPQTSIEEQIVAESLKGTDLNTLSRKFHLSADHISLILKVARKKNR